VEFSRGFIFTPAPVIVIIASFRRQRLNACQIHSIYTYRTDAVATAAAAQEDNNFISWEDSNQSEANSEYIHR